MKAICLKMEKSLLKDIDTRMKLNRYSTRTEFIRDAIRHRLNDLEKADIIKKLTEYKGKLKSKKTDKQAAEETMKSLITELGVNI